MFEQDFCHSFCYEIYVHFEDIVEEKKEGKIIIIKYFLDLKIFKLLKKVCELLH